MRLVLFPLILFLGWVWFKILKHCCHQEDKGMAASLTTGFLALCAAVIAWSLTQQQITAAQQQANMGLATYLEVRLENIEDLRYRVKQTALALGDVTGV
jgi:hypothetical protein